nr:hypothetical protein [Tanacetum cinerariifolium]
THDTNILAGTQADDSDSECDEQVILVPSFPSNSFSAHSVAAKYGFDFSDDTAALLHQEAIETRRNLVLATRDPVPSIVSTGGVPASSVLASGVLAGSLPASGVPAGSVPASGVPAGSLPASSLPASGVPAGSVPASGVPAALNVAVDHVATKRVNTIHPQS